MKRDYEALSQALDPNERIPSSLLEKLDTTMEEVNKSSHLMSKLAEDLLTFNKQFFYLLPFDHSLEAECFGAAIYYDLVYGSRVVETPFKKKEDLKNIKAMDLTNKRVEATLKTVEILEQNQKTVCFNITGPATIAEMLLGSKLFFSNLKKDNTMDLFLAEIEKGLQQWLQIVLNHPVDVISYADPTGDASILGPKIFKESIGLINYRILNHIKSKLEKRDTVFHIHPALTASMLDNGFIKIENTFIPEEKYPESILEIKKKNTNIHFISRLNEEELVQLILNN